MVRGLQRRVENLWNLKDYGKPGEAIVWDAQTGRSLLMLKGHSAGVSSVAFSPDGTQIITGSWDKTAKVWDTQTGREIRTLTGHTEGVSSVAYSPDSQQVVTGSYDKTVKVWNTQTGQVVLKLLTYDPTGIGFVAFSPDGQRIVAGNIGLIMDYSGSIHVSGNTDRARDHGKANHRGIGCILPG